MNSICDCRKIDEFTVDFNPPAKWLWINSNIRFSIISNNIYSRDHKTHGEGIYHNTFNSFPENELNCVHKNFLITEAQAKDVFYLINNYTPQHVINYLISIGFTKDV